MNAAMLRAGALALLAATASPGTAEPLVQPGDRVRFTILRPPSLADGHLLFVAPDTLALREFPSGQVRILTRASVGAVEHGMVRGTRAGHGAVVGLLVGAAAGCAFGLAVQEDDTPVAAPLALFGGLVGSGVGGFMGSFSRVVQWSPAALPPGSAGLPAWTPSVALAAQGRTPPRPGDRVRVSRSDRSTVVGHLAAAGADELELSAGADSTRRLTLSRASIASLEVQRRGSRSGLGAVVGAVVCGVGVRAIHAASSSHEDFSNVPIASLVIGSLGGAMAGALVGRAFRHDRWEPAPLP